MAANSTTTNLTPAVLKMTGTLRAPFVLYSVVNVVLSLTAFFGNAFIFDALRKSSSLQPPSKAFFFSLVLSDLAVGLVAQPLFVTFLLAVITNNTDVYSVTRYAYNLIGDVLGAVSLLTMTGISIDRLLALVLRFTYRRQVTVKRVGAVIVTFWLMSSLLASVYFWNLALYVMVSFVGLLICLVITLLAYLKICLKLRNVHSEVHDSASPSEIQRNGNMVAITMARYKRTVVTARYIFGALLACYLPRLFVLIAWHVQGKSAALFAVYYFTSTLVFANSSLNPVLYCWRIKEIRVLTRQRLETIWLSVLGT